MALILILKSITHLFKSKDRVLNSKFDIAVVVLSLTLIIQLLCKCALSNVHSTILIEKYVHESQENKSSNNDHGCVANSALTSKYTSSFYIFFKAAGKIYRGEPIGEPIAINWS